MEDRELPMLEAAIGQIWDKAREFGLDPFPTQFEIVPAAILYEFGAYLLPGRFSHWTHGKAYYAMKTQYDYGLSKIYELVINNNPAYAFLLETNTLLQNKFVVAHVLGHTDFFKHNAHFAATNRQMLESTSQTARRFRRYAYEEGERAVEEYLDAVLAVAEHVDAWPRREKPAGSPASGGGAHYDDLFEKTPEPAGGRPRPPGAPERDLLRFILEHAQLEEWQADVIASVREESLYFQPQLRTKICNEGWACYWHNRILRDLNLDDAEFVEFAALHGGICAPGRHRLNPYQVGFRIFEDIEARLGREAIFQARELESDASLIRSYLTEELARELDLFVYALDGEEFKVTETDWEVVRDVLASSLSTHHQPVIVVEDGDWQGNRHLYLRHEYDGRPLDLDYAEHTLEHLHKLWGRPVHLETVVAERPMLLSCDGDEVSKTVL